MFNYKGSMASINSEDLFLSRAKFVMKYLGVWLPPINESLLHKIHRYVIISLQYLFLLFQIIYVIQVWGDLAAIAQAVYVLFTQSCLCLKITVFHLNVDNLRDILERMNGPVFEPKSFIHKEILKRQATRIKQLLLGFLISAQLTCGLWALKPLFDDAGSRSFPFDMWMPLSHESSPQYEIGFIFQLTTICMSATMYFGVDSITLSMVIFSCAQLDIIKDKIMSVTSVSSKLKPAEKKKKLSKNYKKLIECVDQYQALYAFTTLVENTYHTYILFQMAGCVGIFCLTGLRMLAVNWKSVQFFSSLSYMCVMISQLFVCCWCGHELTATSEDLHTVMYKCIWYEQDVRFKRDFCFATMRMSRPMVLRAGHYIRLSRQTFVAILRMSYSYFAVLMNQAAE